MMSLAIGINLLPVFLTTLRTLYGDAEGLTNEQLGRLGALVFLGLTCGIVVTGPLADRWGPKRFALLGNAFIAASLGAMAWAPSYTALGAAMLAMGFGAGMLDMVLSPVVAALHPARRAAAMNWLHSFYCVGAAVTIGLGTLALQAGLGWRGACLLLAPLPLGLIAAMAPLRFPSLVPEGQARHRLREIGREGWFAVALVAIFLGGATELGMAQWLPAYTETSLGYPVWVGGSALLAFSIAMAAGRMALGALGARVDPFRVMAGCSAVSVVLFLLGAFLPVPPLALAACILVGFTGSCLWPTMLAVTADRYPQGGASMFGALAALGNAGGIFMPWIVGWVADWRDLHWGLATSALAPLLLLPALIALARGRRPA
jgi:fucose permease